MIKGVGCDIVKISRISSLLDKYGGSFRRRICTALEISKAPTHSKVSNTAYYAKRFAAKEAFMKACGTGIGKAIGFVDLEVVNNEFGAPQLFCRKYSDMIIHLSLSDEKEFAIAYVVIESDSVACTAFV